MVPRKGSIYARLDKARAQRLLILTQPIAANDQLQTFPTSTRSDAPSKSHLLPRIKPQEAFDPPVKNSRAKTAFKLGIGIIAFSAMAGFTLTDWQTSTPQTAVVAPVVPALEEARTNISQPDSPTRVAEVSMVSETTEPSLPVIPLNPVESSSVQLQQEAEPLKQPIVE